MKATILEMLTSKKFLAAAISAIVYLAGRFGWHVDSTQLMPAVAPLWAYVLGQGLADQGKSAAQIVADNAAPTTTAAPGVAAVR
jgi:hypothetical protein